jgi:hypothetical protein
LWNAAADRKHVHEQTEDAFLIERLHVRGKVIDYVDVISPTKFTKDFEDVDDAYFISLVNQIKRDIPDLSNRAHIALVHFLSIVAANGAVPERSAEGLLTTSGRDKNTFRDMSDWKAELGLALAMG